MFATLTLISRVTSTPVVGHAYGDHTSSGFISLASGLSVILGANVETTLIVQVLSFNLAMVAPLLVLSGAVVFRRGDGNTEVEELGRILIGLD